MKEFAEEYGISMAMLLIGGGILKILDQLMIYI